MLLFAVPVLAQEPRLFIDINVAPESVVEQSFRLNNNVDCSRLRYTFTLTPDRDFVRLPNGDEIEMSRNDSAMVPVTYNSAGLGQGVHTANITISCKYCGQCRVRDKLIRITMTVDEPAAPDGSDASMVAEPDITEIEAPPADDVDADTEDMADVAADPEPEQQSSEQQSPEQESPAQDPDTNVVAATGDDGEAADPAGELDETPAEDGAGRASSGAGTGAGGLQTSSDESEDSAEPAGITEIDIDGDERGLSPLWLPTIALLLVLGFFIVFWRRSHGPGAAAVKIDVQPNVDFGTQRVSPEGAGKPQLLIRLRPTGKAGEQSVHGDPTTTTQRKSQ